MKKFIAILLTGIMAMNFAACGQKSDQTKTENTNSSEKVYKIGIVQLVEHEALSSARQGFIDGLAEAGYVDGDNIKIDYENANGEQANCVNIADTLINNKNDLILAIATPAAQAVANKTKDIPILVTAVTDPASAKLVKSNDKPQTNVSGTSDLAPIKQQIGLIKELYPNAKKVGMLYCSSEANSKYQVEIAKKECEALGIETSDTTVSNTNEIQQAIQSLVGKVDAVYAPTDNMIASGMPSISMVAVPANLPIFVGEEGPVKNGGLATYGINYYNLGKQTAAQAVKILKDGAKPADMPIEYLDKTELYINKIVADKMGVNIPQNLLDNAKLIEK